MCLNELHLTTVEAYVAAHQSPLHVCCSGVAFLRTAYLNPGASSHFPNAAARTQECCSICRHNLAETPLLCLRHQDDKTSRTASRQLHGQAMLLLASLLELRHFYLLQHLLMGQDRSGRDNCLGLRLSIYATSLLNQCDGKPFQSQGQCQICPAQAQRFLSHRTMSL